MKVQVSWQETQRGANGLKKGVQGCASDRRKMLTHFKEGGVWREKFIRGKRNVERGNSARALLACYRRDARILHRRK